MKTKSATIIAFAITVLCAVGDEIHQIFVPGRAFQTSDILVDSAGALIGNTRNNCTIEKKNQGGKEEN